MRGNRRGWPLGDDGVMLLAVLLFVTVVGLALAALIPYTRAGLAEAVTARDVRSTQNAIDGAMQGAIANVRRDAEQGNERSGRCDPYNAAPYLTPVINSAVNVQVTCQNALGPGSPSGPDVPPYAIVATAGDVVVDGNHTLAVDGGMYVSGKIDASASNTKVVVTGDAISGTKNCINVFATGLRCPASVPASPNVNFPSALGLDVAAAKAGLAALPKDPLGTCTSATSIVTFVPGYYSEPPTAGPTCKAPINSNTSKTWWFSPCTPYPSCVNPALPPGVYFFDFPDGSYGTNYTDTGSSTTGPGNDLDLDTPNINLIGGALGGGLGSGDSESTVLGRPAGKRCDPASLGVQVVLAGPSQIKTGNGSFIEICASATSATSKQRIALYGLSGSYGLSASTGHRTPTDNGPDGVAAIDPATTPTTLADLPFRNLADSADNPDGARAANDGLNVAVANFTGHVGALTFGSKVENFPLVAAGSLIAQAFVDVTHLETDNQITPQLKITYSSGFTETCGVPRAITTVPTPLTALTQVSFTVSRVDLMTCGSKHLANTALRWKELTPDPTNPTKRLSIVVEEAGTNPATGQGIVDGVQLQTTTIDPALEAQRCPSASTPPCTVVAYSNSGSTSTDNTFFIGSVYTPSAALIAVVHNSPSTIFQRGVVVAAAAITANTSSKQTDPPFQLPHSPVRNRTVLFVATADGRVRLRALVHFTDCLPASSCELTPNAPGNLPWPGKSAQVQSWTPLP
jgi:hypothetical protein